MVASQNLHDYIYRLFDKFTMNEIERSGEIFIKIEWTRVSCRWSLVAFPPP